MKPKNPKFYILNSKFLLLVSSILFFAAFLFFVNIDVANAQCAGACVTSCSSFGLTYDWSGVCSVVTDECCYPGQNGDYCTGNSTCGSGCCYMDVCADPSVCGGGLGPCLNNIPGNCINTNTDICFGTLTTGNCSGPANIRCCTLINGWGSCTGGFCIDTSIQNCSGTLSVGNCPGPAQIQCCSTGGGPGPSPTPTPGPGGGGTALGIVPCGPGTGGPAECTLCLLLKLVENIINFLINVSFGLAAVMILFAVFLFFTAAGNPSKLQNAKSVLSAALIGLIIVLTAWTIINTLVIFFTNTTNWYSVGC